MPQELPKDMPSRVGYRIAYGEAARLFEMAQFDHGWVQDIAAGIGDEAEEIEKEVIRRYSPWTHPAIAKHAVRDALEPHKRVDRGVTQDSR
jgi:hypothetical protein